MVSASVFAGGLAGGEDACCFFLLGGLGAGAAGVVGDGFASAAPWGLGSAFFRRLCLLCAFSLLGLLDVVVVDGLVGLFFCPSVLGGALDEASPPEVLILDKDNTGYTLDTTFSL